MTKQDNRNIYIDCLKGMLAIFVVLGHCTIHSENPILRFTGCICYSFHMFLFIFVSGYLVGDKEKNGNWILKRTKRLIIPYVVWSLLCGIYVSDSVSTIIYKLFLDPYYWYLLILFLCDCLVMACERCFGNHKYAFWTSGGFLFVVLNIFYAYGGRVQRTETYKMLTIYFGFYFLGYCIKKYKIELKKWIITVCMIFYPISMLLYGYKDHSRQEMIVREILDLARIPANKANAIISFLNPTGFVLYNHFIVSFLGCVFFSQIAKYLYQKKIINRSLVLCGVYSLQIYLLSAYFEINTFNSVYLNTVFSVLLGVIAPIVIGWFLHKFKWIDKILFG